MSSYQALILVKHALIHFIFYGIHLILRKKTSIREEKRSFLPPSGPNVIFVVYSTGESDYKMK